MLHAMLQVHVARDAAGACRMLAMPQVRFPNPEEGEGALALAIQTADAAGSVIYIALAPK